MREYCEVYREDDKFTRIRAAKRKKDIKRLEKRVRETKTMLKGLENELTALRGEGDNDGS